LPRRENGTDNRHITWGCSNLNFKSGAAQNVHLPGGPDDARCENLDGLFDRRIVMARGDGANDSHGAR
jgi:hypothetical protein